VTAPHNAASVFRAKVYPCGYTRPNNSGCGSEVWQRWALVPIGSNGLPALRWRDSKPRHVGPRSSGKEAPLWLRRAEAFCSRVGPLTLNELDGIAEWFRTNARKGGEPDLDSFLPF
jgi:hypothetical protein